MTDESHDSAFLALNPDGKIPAIYDPDGPSGTPLALFESEVELTWRGVICERRRIETMISVRRPMKESRP